jgi:hypothetical protein
MGTVPGMPGVPGLPALPAVTAESVSFDVKPASVLKQWQQLARVAIDAARRDEDPGRVIEERVLAQLKETFGDAVIEGEGKPKVKMAKVHPPKPPSKSIAKQIETLNELRQKGVLSDEQYSKAVDRLLAEG